MPAPFNKKDRLAQILYLLMVNKVHYEEILEMILELPGRTNGYGSNHMKHVCEELAQRIFNAVPE